jgi:hypothetical protein
MVSLMDQIMNINFIGVDPEMYRKFEEQSLDEQADQITHDLVYGERNLLFDFDNQDKV